MPPFKATQEVLDTLAAKERDIVNKDTIERVRKPAHKRLSARASDIIAVYGCKDLQLDYGFDKGERRGRKPRATAWFENPVLADTGTQLYYRLVRGGAFEHYDLTTLAIEVKVTKPNPLNPGTDMVQSAQVAHLGCKVMHSIDDTKVWQDDGVTTMPYATGPGSERLALNPEDEVFTTISDTLDFISAAAQRQPVTDPAVS